MSDIANLSGKNAIEKMKELAEETDFCMFCTQLDQVPFSTRPMSTQEVDDQGNFWFFSNKSSHKNAEVRKDSRVQLIYSNPGKSAFLSVFGTATEFYDRAKVEEHWGPLLKTWFQEGKDDPELMLIKVKAEEGYYWNTKNGQVVAMAKIVLGAVTGKELDDSIEGSVKLAS